MPETCTCGAELAPGSLFCHKCGKPQREIVVPDTANWQNAELPPAETAAPPTPAPPPRQAPPPLNFHNPVAVRIALLVAVCATILSFVPFLNWIAAGFFAVFFYRRKTGSLLNVGAGARMGWITGLLMFGLWTVLFTAQQVPAALNGKLGSLLQEQMKSLPAHDPMVQQMMGFFQTGPGIFVVLFLSLAAFFLFITGLSIAGGAIGAKLVGGGELR
jgi:hypothetical protein